MRVFATALWSLLNALAEVTPYELQLAIVSSTPVLSLSLLDGCSLRSDDWFHVADPPLAARAGAGPAG